MVQTGLPGCWAAVIGFIPVPVQRRFSAGSPVQRRFTGSAPVHWFSAGSPVHRFPASGAVTGLTVYRAATHGSVSLGLSAGLPGCRAAVLLVCWVAGLLGCWARLQTGSAPVRSRFSAGSAPVHRFSAGSPVQSVSEERYVLIRHSIVPGHRLVCEPLD